MKFIKMFIFLISVFLFTSCESGFDDMMNDANDGLAALESVTVSIGNLSPAFNRGVTNYTVTEDSTTDALTITAVPVKSDAKMQYRIDGGVWAELTGAKTISGLLSAANQTIKYEIQVTSADGDGVAKYSFAVIIPSHIVLTTTIATDIHSVSATTGGNITDDAGLSITSRGVCWSTSNNPTINDPKTVEGTGVGNFTSNISGLIKGGTVYYVRAYATSSSGNTVYGNEVSLKTCGYTGPGGGLVFYDKGEITNGWRYLEAAPSDSGSTMPWASTFLNTGYDPGGGPRSTANIGDGLSNTANVIAEYSAESKTATAAVECDNYSNNGLDDWFLPSSGEMDLMYLNLHLHGLGNFKSGSSKYYWTSTQQQDAYWYQYSIARDFAYNQSFGMANYYTGYTNYVRPARRF